jgi:beta-lactamase class A
MAELKRRQILAGAVLMAGAAAVYWAPAAFADPLTDAFVALENQHNARLGVFAADLNSPRVVAYREGERWAMCSTFKGYAVGRVLQMVDRGQIRLDVALPVMAGDIRANSPVTEKAVGRSLTLAELCQAALQQSDNAAGNLLLGTIGGPQAITVFARELGDDQTRLDRWETELNSALPGDVRDTTTPAGLATGYRTLLAGSVLAPPSRDQLEEWMRGSLTSAARFRAGLPPGWTSADKTGAGDYGTTNDVGMVFGPDGRRFVLAVLSQSRSDDPMAPALNALVAAATSNAVAALTS